ncbi:MAG: hypothetical protein AUK47_20535 [Deltaproteobacteria bacterium CG2_30_63_29]|nr:MAG: hypothetical protein AUK47_20535 [Deltaproteobacteria bacterium CG2_30_63_29]
MRAKALSLNWLPRFLAASALIATFVGCAEERQPIDRVQPQALDKAFFVGKDLVGTQDDPEFWTQGTLIDVGYGASQDGLFTSTYAQPMSRIKWQITEDLLIGRIAYERIDNSDGKGLGGPVEDGVIAVAYRIESHFDISKAYNPVTGEQLNIVEENTADRPWYERQYFRVDWSRNLNTDGYDFDTLSLMGIYGGVSYESMAYDVTDPSDPDAPFFDQATGYFDVTNKAFAKPGLVDLSSLGWGMDSFPACFLDNDFMGGSAPTGSCSPVELTIRQSFRPVVDTDYEPVDWDGYRFQAYGAFTVERTGYARNYGMTDSQWKRFIARYNIWERSHYYANPETMEGAVACNTEATTGYGEDPHRDTNGDGTEDECVSVGAGSRCDEFRHACTLPFAQRTPKPVAWYYTNVDPTFFRATAIATHDWDVGLRMAVRSAQYAECVNTGGSYDACKEKFPLHFGQQQMNEDTVALALEVDNCRAGVAYPELNRDETACQAVADEVGAKRGYDLGVIDLAKMPEMLVLCHSPVEFGDPVACGARRLPAGLEAVDCKDALYDVSAPNHEECASALTVRMGDLRYHQVNVITEPQTPSPWGIYTDAEDPLTGETIAASINCWSHVNDLWSQSVVDMARYIAGELKSEDVTEGENIRKWAEAANAAKGGGVAPKMTQDELQQRLADFSGVMPSELMEMSQLPQELAQQARELKQKMRGVVASLDAPSVMMPLYTTRAQQAKGTQFEASLITPMVQQMMGIDGMPLTDNVLDQASPLRGGNPSFKRDFENFREAAMADHNSCVMREAPAPASLTGLTEILQAKFGAFNPEDDLTVQEERAERMRVYVANQAHRSVIVHEMGHSIGLRHNFVSSSDPLVYRPQYWQLRTQNGTEKTACSELVADGASCVGPRYFDPVTPNEADNLIWMFMQSSIMDYAGEITQDMLGPGVWDFAGARMFYGDVVPVFAHPSYLLGTSRGDSMLSLMDNFGGILGYSWTFGQDEVHYSQLQNKLDLISNCQPVLVSNFIPAGWNAQVDGIWNPVLDGKIVSVNGSYTRCDEQSVDYVPWTSLRSPDSGEGPEYYYGGQAIDRLNRVRVPYGFGTDSWADLGNASVYRHDNGADIYELFDFFITQQEMGHIFYNYRRGRTTFSVRAAADRTLERYNTKMRDGAKGLVLMKNIYRKFALELGYDFDTLWPEIAPLYFKENILASGVAFDHFTRMMARPQSGEHYRADDGVLRSNEDTSAGGGPSVVSIPNGATGYFGDIGIGGRPVENGLADDKGEYDSSYTVYAGSYYDKMYTSMLMTESVDNYISSSRTDFIDARDRATALADLFPEGYRRWLANNLTNDHLLTGPRIAAGSAGQPLLDSEGYPASAIGWTTWWGETPRPCFPGNGSTICSTYGLATADPYNAEAPANTLVLDPEVGWEQQKFLIAWTLLYLPENQQQNWIDQMRVWELGVDADPGFESRIEFHNPNGKIYVAKTFGKELIFGEVVEKGVAARVLEYANGLMAKAYVTDPGPDLDNDGTPDWVIPRIDPGTGIPSVRYDPTVSAIVDGYVIPTGTDTCNARESSGCTCTSNRACVELSRYVEVPFYLRQAMDAYGLVETTAKGIYD